MSNAGTREHAFEALFRPRSVAVVGASASPFKQGNVAIKYLIAGGFEGAIHPINPGGGDIEGLPAIRSVLDVPGDIDCALFVIPAAATLDAVRQCALKGVRAIIVGSNGFAELGTDEGRARQAQLTALAHEHGMRVLGPNTNGVWNANARFSLGYNKSHGDPMILGPVSIAAHSGALFNSIAPALAAFGAHLSKFVPVGNEADLDMLDFLEFFIGDPDTRVIGLIMEGVRDGNRLRALARRAHEAGKPIVALKLGRSEAGAGAALAHSSRLAGSARAYDALLRSCGISRPRSIESLAGACALLANGAKLPSGGDHELVCVSTSGGGAELVADHAADFRIKLAGNPDGSWDGAAAKLIETFDGAGLVRNPVDGGNLAGWPRLEELFKTIESEGRFGPSLLYSHMLPQERGDRTVIDIMLRRRERVGSPFVCVAPGGVRESIARLLAEAGVPVFRDMGTCFDSLRCFYDAVEFKTAAGNIPCLNPAQGVNARNKLSAAAPGAVLTEIDSAAILREVGVSMVESINVSSLDEARATLALLGGSVVLKGVAPGVAHKNDAGLVVTGIANADDMARAHGQISRALAALGGGGHGTRVIVQEMLFARAEFIAGVTREPPLGHFLVVGLGGIYAEALDEAMLFPIPSHASEIENGLRQSRIGALLRRLDASGQPATAPLVDALMALQALVLSCPEDIDSIDVNPFIVGREKSAAVDALIVRR